MAQWIEDSAPAKGGNRAEFYMRPKQDMEATAEQGRPIVKMHEYIKIEVPGDKSLLVDRPVRDDDRAKYGKQYEAFKANKDQETAGGTLLSATGLFPLERIEELALDKIRTVEQLASVSDAFIQRLGLHARGERQRCQDFLEASKSNAPLLRLQAQLEQSEQSKSVMAKQLADLQAAVDELKGKKPVEKAWGKPTPGEAETVVAAPKRRGRPPKESVEVSG